MSFRRRDLYGPGGAYDTQSKKHSARNSVMGKGRTDGEICSAVGTLEIFRQTLSRRKKAREKTGGVTVFNKDLISNNIPESSAVGDSGIFSYYFFQRVERGFCKHFVAVARKMHSVARKKRRIFCGGRIKVNGFKSEIFCYGFYRFVSFPYT